MEITGLHLLLTYQCNYECDHCFVWGSPSASGTLTLDGFAEIMRQARELGTVRSIYFEGGEPFLFYAVLKIAVEEAHRQGYEVGVVTNSYWATGAADAVACLAPFAGLLADLSISSDLFHGSEMVSRQASWAKEAAEQLQIPVGMISIAPPETGGAGPTSGQLPPGTSGVMYRGRAAVRLVDRAGRYPWEQFDRCPHEDLRDPGRLHVDPFGYVHLCQGIALGNLFVTPLSALLAGYQPEAHPVAGPLLAGGPAEIARRYGVKPNEGYADACHLCYSTRLALRSRFTDILQPDQMYGAL